MDFNQLEREVLIPSLRRDREEQQQGHLVLSTAAVGTTAASVEDNIDLYVSVVVLLNSNKSNEKNK